MDARRTGYRPAVCVCSGRLWASMVIAVWRPSGVVVVKVLVGGSYVIVNAWSLIVSLSVNPVRLNGLLGSPRLTVRCIAVVATRPPGVVTVCVAAIGKEDLGRRVLASILPEPSIT
jgi:hypothetical protein